MTASHNFQLLKQSLEDEMKFATETVRASDEFTVHWESRGDAESFAAVTAAGRDEPSAFESQP